MSCSKKDFILNYLDAEDSLPRITVEVNKIFEQHKRVATEEAKQYLKDTLNIPSFWGVSLNDCVLEKLIEELFFCE
jgi:hypothetical protein